MKTDTSIFGHNLRWYRKFHNLSQKKLAYEVGLKLSNIGSYEEGRAAPSLEKLIAICDRLNVSIDKMIRSKIITID